MKILPKLSGSMMLACLATVAAWAGAPEPLVSSFGPIGIQNGMPAPTSISTLYDERDYQQAVQSYLWALPAVSFAQWQHEQANRLGAKNGDLIVYRTFSDKKGILTANATTPYVIAFVDLSQTGPMVIEMPAGHTAGAIGDVWQREMASLGETGSTGDKGGRYLVMPPGYPVPEDADGYTAVISDSVNILLGFRVLDPDPVQAEKLIGSFGIYPYALRNNPPPTRVMTPENVPWYGGPPSGLAYWQRLHALIQTEPVQERDRFFYAMLAENGIEKGKPFRPDSRRKAILERAARMGEHMAQAAAFAKRTKTSVVWPGSTWRRVTDMADPSQRVTHYDQLNERAAWFYEAVTYAKSMSSTSPGVGQAYLGAYTDRAGNWLDGGRDYTLVIPAHPPAVNFWSLTVYDAITRAYIDSPVRVPDKSSRMPLLENADGSVTLYFGPEAPPGKERNWIQTIPGKNWFAYFRLYGPMENYFNHSWKLGDIEVVSSASRASYPASVAPSDEGVRYQ